MLKNKIPKLLDKFIYFWFNNINDNVARYEKATER